MIVSLQTKNGCHYIRRQNFFLLLTVFLLLFLFSCGQEEKKVVIPSDVLLKEKMAKVLTDIHLAEAESNVKALPDSIPSKKLSFQKIFDKNNISKEQYEKSLKFYIDHPKLLGEVYDKVLIELSKMQTEK